MEKQTFNYYNFVKQNSFETVKLNLNFKNGECKNLVKIGSSVSKNTLVAGGKGLPNIFAPFDSKITDIKKVRTAKNNVVSTHLELTRTNINQKLENKNIEVKSPLDFLIHIESKGVLDTSQNCDFFDKIYPKINKIENLVLNFYDEDEFTFTYKYLFCEKLNENVNLIKKLNTIFNFKTITIYFDKQNLSIVSRYKELLIKDNINVKFIPIKNNTNKFLRLKLKYLFTKVSTSTMVKNKSLYFDAKTFFDVFRALIENQPITSSLISVNGDAIQNTGIYLLPLGVSFGEIIELAKVKNSYEYIDCFFINAMEAYNDQVEFDKEINQTQDEEKKQKLIEEKTKKEREANELIYSKMEETRDYYNNCLGLVYEVIGSKGSGIFSKENVITQSTNALIMITRKTLKRIK